MKLGIRNIDLYSCASMPFDWSIYPNGAFLTEGSSGQLIPLAALLSFQFTEASPTLTINRNGHVYHSQIQFESRRRFQTERLALDQSEHTDCVALVTTIEGDIVAIGNKVQPCTVEFSETWEGISDNSLNITISADQSAIVWLKKYAGSPT